MPDGGRKKVRDYNGFLKRGDYFRDWLNCESDVSDNDLRDTVGISRCKVSLCNITSSLLQFSFAKKSADLMLVALFGKTCS